MFLTETIKLFLSLTVTRAYDIIYILMSKKRTIGDKKTLSPTARFFRRFWYWFVTVPVLIAVSVVWLYFLGVFEDTRTKKVTLSTSSPESIFLLPENLFRFFVTASDGSSITYSSSDENVAEVSEEGIVYTHSPGTCDIYAKAADQSVRLSVIVSRYAIKWFKVAGDTFTDDDILSAIPDLEGVVTGYTPGESYDCYTTFQNEQTVGSSYRINGIGSSPIWDDYTYFAITLYGMESYVDPVYGDMYRTVSLGEILVYVFAEEDARDTAQTNYDLQHQREALEPMNTFAKEIDLTCLSVIDVLSEIVPEFVDVTTSGLVSFYLEDCSVSYTVKQSGKLVVSSKCTCYIRVYIGETLYNRYRLNVNPIEVSESYSLQDFITVDSLREKAPNDVASFSASDKRLIPQYEGGNLIGFIANELADPGTLFILGKDSGDHLIFRSKIAIYEKIDYDEEVE